MKQTNTEIRLTQAQMGAACELSQGQVSRSLRDAGIEPGGDGYTLTDLRRLVEWRTLDRVGATSDGRRFDTDAERGRLLAAQANLAELKLAVEKKELVSAPEVLFHWQEIAIHIRQKLTQLPSRISLVCAHTHEARVKMQALAENLVRDALEEVARGPMPPEDEST
jgi:phage terminase Nu1 subunit (DNA packaging protein)